MGSGEDPAEVAQQQLHLVDEQGRANEQTETSVPKSSRRCIGTPPCWVGVTTLVLLMVGVYGLTRLPKDPLPPPPDVSRKIPEGGNSAAFPAFRDTKDWLNFHEKHKAEAEERGESVRMLAIGDSITEELLGTSLGQPRENYGSPEVWAEYYEGLGALNLGVSGDQTQHVLWRMQNGELPDVLQPQSIMLAIGTNNLGCGMNAQDTVGGIKAVIKDLREQRPDALIVVVTLFPRASLASRHDPTPWPLIDEVNGLVEHMIKLKFGEDKVHFINCNENFLVTDSTGRQILNHELLLEDNLHLTSKGLAEWAECVSEEIRSGLTDP